jgi:hypothetical protein
MIRLADMRAALTAALPGSQVTATRMDFADGGFDEVRFLVSLRASGSELDRLLAADAKARLEADRTLGGLCADVRVTRCDATPDGATWHVAARV